LDEAKLRTANPGAACLVNDAKADLEAGLAARMVESIARRKLTKNPKPKREATL